MKLYFSYSLWKQSHNTSNMSNFYDYKALDGRLIDFGNKSSVKVNGVLIERLWCEREKQKNGSR